jgi:hypothetical protein
MVTRYKLTDAKGFTHSHTEWGPGRSYSTNGNGELCSSSWLHCYRDPLLAILLNPIHANFNNPKMCIVECSGFTLEDKGLKEGWTNMAFIKWIDTPKISSTKKIVFSILCTKTIYHNKEWNKWADAWLNNKDRTANAAANAANAANAAYTAYTANAAYAAYAAAYTAAYAANAANAANVKVDLITIAKEAMKFH